MQILLINHYAGSPRHGMEYRPFYLAREWARLGHSVTIAASSVSHVRSTAPDISGGLTEEQIEGVRYVWLRTPAYSGNGAGRVVNIFSFLGGVLWHRQRLSQVNRAPANGRSPALVIASSTYPLDIWPARRIAVRLGARLVYEVHDLWPLAPIELGGLSPRHPFTRLLQWAEEYAYRHADRVVSMLPLAEPHMRAHGLAAGKFAYIPNGIDLEEWRAQGWALPAEHRAALDALRERAAFIVSYAGSHGLANELDSLLQAAASLRGEAVGFVLVGQGPEKARLEQAVRQAGLERVVFLPPVAKAQVPALLAACDALYIGWQRQPMYRFGVCPNKLLDYMMSARPVIHAIEAGNDLVAEAGCGITTPPQDAPAIAAAIRRLAALTPEQRAEMGRRGRDYAASRHDYRLLARQFLEAVSAEPHPAG